MLKTPFLGNREREIAATSEYALCRCAYRADKDWIVFVTHPTIWVHHETRQLQPRAAIGTLDIKCSRISPLAADWHPVNRVTGWALIPNGLVSCSPAGLIATSFGAKRPELLYGGLNYDEQVKGVTVHPDGSLWATSVFARRGVFIGRIVRIEHQIVEQITLQFHFRPNAIAISPDGRRCYVMCDLNKTVYYHAIAGTTLGPPQVLSFIQLRNVRAIKVDVRGQLFVSCGAELRCWDQHAMFLGSMTMSETILDFDFSPRGMIIMFMFRWVLVERDWGVRNGAYKSLVPPPPSRMTAKQRSRI